MRVLVVNNVRGHFAYLVRQIENNDPDCVVLIGNSGIYFGDKSDTYLKGIGGYDEEILLNDRWGFKKVLDGETKMPKPTYALNYKHDNNRLFERLERDNCIDNFTIMTSGKLYEVGDCRFAGLGGTYDKNDEIEIGNVFGLYHVKKLLENKQLDLFFMNEPVGGMSEDGAWDLYGEYDLDYRRVGIYDINEELDVCVAFFGTDMKIEGADYVSCPMSGGSERFLCWCKSMKEMCYIYDTELKQIIYV